MIAPIRKGNEPTTMMPRATSGMRRARRWVAKTLIERPAPTTTDTQASWRIGLATAWIVLVAAAYFAHLWLDFGGSR